MQGCPKKRRQRRRYLAFSFLCTFVPGSEKSIDRTFAPAEFSFNETFAPEERMFQELLFHGTFAPVERSLHKQLCALYLVDAVYVNISLLPKQCDEL